MRQAYVASTVGHWRISKEVIGSGTTSTVRLATHDTNPTIRAAVKIVSRTGLLVKADGDPSALHLADAVIHREVLLMKLAANERIIKLYDFVGHGDLVYMVLEHAPNKTLFDLFRAYPSFLPIPLVTHLFSQLMHAIDHIHSLHIVHRDIKLENVFLFGPDIKDVLQSDANCIHRTHKHRSLLSHNAKNAQPFIRDALPPPYTSLSLKLADFGLSHTHTPSSLSTVYHGSPHYQAPELWARVPHLPLPTDVWSAGVVLFALVGRRLPFDVGELEEWGGVFGQNSAPHTHEPHVETDHVLAHKSNAGKGDIEHPPAPRPGSPAYVPYNAVEMMTPTIDNLLHRLFALDPALRPTAQEVLSDALFSGTGCLSPHVEISILQKGGKHHAGRLPALRNQHADDRDMTPTPSMNPGVPYDLYDIATLCTPPSTHVPPASFRGSSLERRVQKRLEDGKGCIEKVWASKLGAWKVYDGEGANKEAGEKGRGVEKEKRGEWSERTGWGKSLGRIRGADVCARLATLGHLGHSGQRAHIDQVEHATLATHRGHEGSMETKPVYFKPKHGASLSFRSLRIKTEHKTESKLSAPHIWSPLASTFTARRDAAPSIANPSPLQPPHPNVATLQTPPSPLKPKLSIRTLCIKTDFKQPLATADAPSPFARTQTPTCSTHQLPVAQCFTSRHEATPTIRTRHDTASTIRSRHDAILPLEYSQDLVASTLQSRHDALLRRAYELGFGTQDLRAFADEAGRIVRDAREGTKGSVVGEDNEAAVGGASDAITPSEGSSSTAATLVPENAEGSKKMGVCVPSADAYVVGDGRAGRMLDVDMDITFDVDFETDSRWMSRWM